MADKDSNIIKPVEGLHNIAGLAPAKRREERKRRQNLHEEENQEPEHESDEPADQQNSGELSDNGDGQSAIDYCA
jgi:hypothetical protein